MRATSGDWAANPVAVSGPLVGPGGAAVKPGSEVARITVPMGG